MYIDREVFEDVMDKHGYGITETASKMDITRSYLWKILNHKQKAGSKFTAGLIKAFPNDRLESFFLR